MTSIGTLQRRAKVQNNSPFELIKNGVLEHFETKVTAILTTKPWTTGLFKKSTVYGGIYPMSKHEILYLADMTHLNKFNKYIKETYNTPDVQYKFFITRGIGMTLSTVYLQPYLKIKIPIKKIEKRGLLSED